MNLSVFNVVERAKWNIWTGVLAAKDTVIPIHQTLTLEDCVSPAEERLRLKSSKNVLLVKEIER